MCIQAVRILAAVVFSTSAYAVDLGPIEHTNEAFNKAASRLGTDTRMVMKDCSSDKAKVCSFFLPGHVGAMASSNSENLRNAANLLFVCAKDCEPTIFMEAMVISMMAWSPKADKHERGQAFRMLTAKIKDSEKGRAVLAGTSYELTPTKGLGLWFTVGSD